VSMVYGVYGVCGDAVNGVYGVRCMLYVIFLAS